MQRHENESETSLSYHGGNLDSAMQLFPAAPKPWIDLSTGINPNAYPIGTIDAAAWARLPQAKAISNLEAIAARAYGTAAHVVAAPGTQALIQLLPRLLQAKTIGIFGFTYGEYARVWRDFGIEVVQVEALEDLAKFELAIVVNPNNPDGRIVAIHDLLMLAGKVQHLVVDEAFIDFEPEHSFAPAQPDNVLILRSFGKTYGLAGLRLGFILAHQPVASLFRRALGPWAISGPAIDIASRALADRPWVQRQAVHLADTRTKLEAALVEAGFSLLGGTHLFVLGAHENAQSYFSKLAAAGVLVRPFAQRQNWLRFGIPAETDWPRVKATLERLG